MNYFKLQVPTSIVKDNTLNCLTFAVYLKLIQIYYQSEFGNTELLQINHKLIMDQLHIKDNRAFKAALNELHNRGFILTQINNLPINKLLTIHLNINVLPEHTEAIFTQLPFVVIEKDILNIISHNGLRLLYYYNSFINDKDIRRQFCFPSLQTIIRETGISKGTTIKYNKILEKAKFVKIEKHQLSNNNEYITVSGKEKLYFTKYNNHYYVNVDKIISYYEKKNIDTNSNTGY